MRILDELGAEIVDPDLEKGYLEEETIILAHHEAVPFKPAVRVKEVIWEDPDDPDRKLYETVEREPVQWPHPAWDDTEPIQRYKLYTEAELAEREARAKAERAEQERLAAEAAEAAAKQAERDELMDALPDAMVEVANIAATNEERLNMLEDAIVEVAALIGE